MMPLDWLMSAHLFFGPRDMVFTELASGKLLYREAITNGILLSGRQAGGLAVGRPAAAAAAAAVWMPDTKV